MTRRYPAAALTTLAGALLALTACGGGGSDTPADDPSSSTGQADPVLPPPQPDSWQPAVPDQPVDAATVRSTYAAVLDDVVGRLGADLSWDGATVTTEMFGERCVVAVARVGDGTLPTSPVDLEAALTPIAAARGFRDLALENDPGGAVLLVARDDADAWLELRSKVDTTVTVRVATTDSAC